MTSLATTSLRTRLLLWYTAMLAVVMVVFGSIVGYLAWRARLADVDDALQNRAETLAAGLHPAVAGTFDLTLPPDVTRTGDEAFYHILWTPAGAVIDRSDPERDAPRPQNIGFSTRDGRRELAIRSSGAYVLVGTPLDDLRAEILNLVARMAVVGLAALGVAFLGGRLIVTRALTPVNRINRTARAMVDGDFSARIPIDGIETELGQTARALNEAFDRLHEALERQRRFTADASHELRTPLALISTETEWALGRDRAGDDYRRSLEVCRRAYVRMQSVIERLLALARAEALAQPDDVLPVRLDELTRAVVDELRSLFDARNLHVTFEAAPVTCLGNRDRLRDAITNVVVNAIQYNAPEGHIRVEVCGTLDAARIVVSDTGIGIAREHLPHVFEPFFRADPARTRTAGGSGLGLAVTHATILRHGGSVVCASEPGSGTTVTITMPRATADLDSRERERPHASGAGASSAPDPGARKHAHISARPESPR